jgi:hypothetical protein
MTAVFQPHLHDGEKHVLKPTPSQFNWPWPANAKASLTCGKLTAKARASCCWLLKKPPTTRDWPMDAITERFIMPNLSKQPDITYAVSYLARTEKIDRIVALDDYDVATAASLREHLRIPGMGETTARHFRDKLAMRVHARPGTR